MTNEKALYCCAHCQTPCPIDDKPNLGHRHNEEAKKSYCWRGEKIPTCVCPGILRLTLYMRGNESSGSVRLTIIGLLKFRFTVFVQLESFKRYRRSTLSIGYRCGLHSSSFLSSRFEKRRSRAVRLQEREAGSAIQLVDSLVPVPFVEFLSMETGVLGRHLDELLFLLNPVSRQYSCVLSDCGLVELSID